MSSRNPVTKQEKHIFFNMADISRTKYIFTNIVETSRVFIDTCSMLHDGFFDFMEMALPILKSKNSSIIIPKSSIGELINLSNRKENETLSQHATNVLIKIAKWRKEKEKIEIRGEENDDTLSDNVFLYVFTRLRRKMSLTLITQDKALAADVYKLNESSSVHSRYTIQVYRLLKQGGIRLHKCCNSTDKQAAETIQKDKPINKFRYCSTLTSIPDAPNQVNEIPGEGSRVIAKIGNDTTTLTLTQRLGSGGEGDIYRTNTPLLAKIYKKQKNTTHKKAKLELMIQKSLNHESICFPVATLSNEQNEFVGYLMPEAHGHELSRSAFLLPLLKKKFPDWKKVNTVKLCLSILRVIKYLHSRNIIVGDINPNNILVESDQKVYFVDTDSYQIEDYPCPVGMMNFTPPEIIGQEFTSFLRTFEHENYAIATLLFMIMLPGKAPYCKQGGENMVKNVQDMDFSYPLGDFSNGKTPDGPWRYIWSHLCYKLKEAFYNTFHKNGEKSAPAARMNVKEWINLFTLYEKLLVDGTMAQQDEMSLELSPNRYKMSSKIEYCNCKLCKTLQPESNCVMGYCKACLKLEEIRKCKICGGEIRYTNYDRYIKKKKPHTTCFACFEHQNAVGKNIKCCNCGSSFEMTNKEIQFYQENNLSLPKRCKKCRNSNKRSNRVNNSNNNSFHSNSNSDTNSGSMCYITTAICEIQGKANDCLELQALRNYRDTWLQHQVGGRELIAEYYRTAPALAASLHADANRSMVADKLYQDYLLPCISFIRNNQPEACREHYIRMVNFISTIY